MLTNGFVASASDQVTIGEFLYTSSGVNYPVTYIYIDSAGSGGDLVWMNSSGVLQFTPGLAPGQYHIIGAIKIVASGTVRGVSRTTTVTDTMAWLAG